MIYSRPGADRSNITFLNLYLFVPVFTPSAGTQAMINEAIRKNYTVSFDSDRNVIIDRLEF